MNSVCRFLASAALAALLGFGATAQSYAFVPIHMTVPSELVPVGKGKKPGKPTTGNYTFQKPAKPPRTKTDITGPNRPRIPRPWPPAPSKPTAPKKPPKADPPPSRPLKPKGPSFKPGGF